MILYAPSEDCLDDIEIRGDIDSDQAKRYSNKKYFSSLRWKFSETRAHELITYMVDHLKTASEIEIWTTWLEELDVEITPIIKTAHINELSVSILNEELGQGYTERPLCLIVTEKD